MPEEQSPAELVGREPDPRLLSEDLAKLPEVLGRPETFVPSGARGRIVGAGATLTAASLVIGCLLVVLGVIDGLANGIDGVPIAIVTLGAVLIATHWGWVHVAEITANSIEGRGSAVVENHRQQWLSTIQPYTHYEISTRVENDGSIAIDRIAYRPAPSGDRRFTFTSVVEQEEVHSADRKSVV